jgi:hypothetical protein
MRGSVLISLFGISMAMAGTIVACGGDEEKAATTPTGAQGESCTRRADCSSGLVCLNQVCQKKGSSATGGSGGTSNEAGAPGSGGTGGASGGTGGKGGGTTGGTGGKGGGTTGGTGGSAPGVDLGGEGESCTRSADCLPGLGCFNNRCQEDATGDAGDGNSPGVNLGGQGETCVLSSDCEEGLICIPADTGGMGTASVGICSPADTGIEPTGKSCFAECLDAADCCELPTEMHATLGAKSCSEIASLLNDAAEDCSAPASDLSALCFAQDVYCDCEDDPSPWTCEGNLCVYEADCSVDGFARRPPAVRGVRRGWDGTMHAYRRHDALRVAGRLQRLARHGRLDRHLRRERVRLLQAERLPPSLRRGPGLPLRNDLRRNGRCLLAARRVHRRHHLSAPEG